MHNVLQYPNTVSVPWEIASFILKKWLQTSSDVTVKKCLNRVICKLRAWSHHVVRLKIHGQKIPPYRQTALCHPTTVYILADSGFFINFLYQGGVKSTVSWVFEDFKFKISEGYDQNWCFPDSAQLAVSAKLILEVSQIQ